jgi:NMD protein affecting ribosome stability and mRNA decay
MTCPNCLTAMEEITVDGYVWFVCPYCGVVDHKAHWAGFEANARLYAAAPEMLEALIKAVYYGEDKLSWNYCNLVPVIEKATGKTWEEVKEVIDE